MITKYTYRRFTGVREQPILNGIPLKQLSSWHTPYFLLINSSLVFNRLYPDMSLTLIPPVLRWEYDISTTLEPSPPIGSPPYNVSHLNPQPDIPLTPKYTRYFIQQALNRNHSFPPIDITFDVNPILVRPNKCLWGPSHVSVHNNINTYQYVLTGNISQIYPCNDVTGSLNLTLLTCNPIRSFPPVIRVHSNFTTLSESLLACSAKLPDNLLVEKGLFAIFGVSFCVT